MSKKSQKSHKKCQNFHTYHGEACLHEQDIQLCLPCSILGINLQYKEYIASILIEGIKYFFTVNGL